MKLSSPKTEKRESTHHWGPEDGLVPPHKENIFITKGESLQAQNGGKSPSQSIHSVSVSNWENVEHSLTAKRNSFLFCESLWKLSNESLSSKDSLEALTHESLSSLHDMLGSSRWRESIFHHECLEALNIESIFPSSVECLEALLEERVYLPIDASVHAQSVMQWTLERVLNIRDLVSYAFLR